MARALGLCGFTGGFLVVSPNLRQTLVDIACTSAAFLQHYSPFSYVGVVVVALGGVALTLASGSNPR